MEYGDKKYITQSDELNSMWYSEPLYTVSTLVGAAQVARTQYGDFGAKYILITGIILSSGIAAGAANLVTFTDIFGRVIFVMDSGREGNGFYEIVKIIPGQQVFVSATFQAPVIADYFFTVKHQYLREVDKVNKAQF